MFGKQQLVALSRLCVVPVNQDLVYVSWLRLRLAANLLLWGTKTYALHFWKLRAKSTERVKPYSPFHHVWPYTYTWQPRLSYIPLGQRTALAALRQCWSRCLGEWLARVVEIPNAKIQRAPIQVCFFCQMPNGSTFCPVKKQKSNVKGPWHV